MSMKTLLGLDDLNITDREIMARFKQAYDQGLNEVEFLNSNGSKVIIKLPLMDHSKYYDPWD
ncbi:hypothetical protein ACFLZB_00180 [Nanoarchaeota archaeon]